MKLPYFSGKSLVFVSATIKALLKARGIQRLDIHLYKSYSHSGRVCANTQLVSGSILPNPIAEQGYIPFSNSMGSVCLWNNLELQELLNLEIAKRGLMQRDLTRQYHAQIAQQELAFRQSLSHFYASASQHEVLQSKSSGQILQPNFGKNLQQTSSRSPDSVLPEGPGWSSLCEVDCKMEVLEKYNLADKHKLISKELKEASGHGREENLKEQKTQTEQQQRERDIIDNLEKQEKKTKEDCIPSNEHERSNSSPLIIEECAIHNKVLNFQDDFDLHLAGQKYAEQLGIMKNSDALSEIKDDGKKCANAGGKELIIIKSGLPVNVNVEKRVKNKLSLKVKDNRDLAAKNEVGIKENAKLNEQQQIMGVGMPDKICERSSTSSQLCIKECKIFNIKDDEKSAENKLVLKHKEDRDLDRGKSNKFDVKENAEPNEQGEMREENSNQQKVQTEQQMMEGRIPCKEYEKSLSSNQLKINGCMICNIVLNFQVDLEAHLAGRKHAKQLKKMENEPVWKVTDDRDPGVKSNKIGMKETAELNEQEQMNGGGMPSKIYGRSSNSRQLSIKECKISNKKDDVEKHAEYKLFWKVKDDKDLGAKHKKVDMTENAELNEQCLMKEENSKQQKPKMEQQTKEGNSKQQKLQLEQQMKEGNSKKQKPQMEQKVIERGVPSKKRERSLTLNQVKGCMIRNNFQVDLEAPLAVRKHAKQLEKMENEPVWKVTDDRDSVVISNKVGLKETAELKGQEQMNRGGMASKICKRPSNSRQLRIKECTILKEKNDVEKHAENKLYWKVKGDTDLGAELKKVDKKENAGLNEHCLMKEENSKQQKPKMEHQMKEGNSKQKNPQMEQQMKEGNSKQQMKEGNSRQQNPQMQQQMKEGNSKQQKPQMEQQIMERGIPSKEHGSSLISNQVKGCMIYNVVLNSEVDFEAHLAGRKHAKHSKKMEDEDLGAQTNKVGMKETMELNDKQHMKGSGMPSKICKRSSNSSQLSINECKIPIAEDDAECAKNKSVWKVKDDRDLGAKRMNNLQLNEQLQIKETNSKQQKLQTEQQQQARNMIDNFKKREEQMKEGVIPYLSRNMKDHPSLNQQLRDV